MTAAPDPDLNPPPPEPAPTRQAPSGPAPHRNPRGWWLLAAIGAIFGLVSASVSTRDFIAHLDGQTHAVSCSVLPGGEAVVGASGCKAAMYSVYSSFNRTEHWGGIPVSLLALAVFAFFTAYTLSRAVGTPTRRDGLFLFVGSLLPVGMSVIYGNIAATELGAFCEVCIGIYVASGVLFLMSILAWWRASPATEGSVIRFWLVNFGAGVGFVAAAYLVYTASVPDDRPTMDGCGFLTDTTDEAGVLVKLGAHNDPSAIPSIAVLDPLCPSCRSFDKRLAASGFAPRLKLEALLFPLDTACNWMVKDAPHPGACAISEAILCAPEGAQQILDWAFADQTRLIELAKSERAASSGKPDNKAEDKALRAELLSRFPGVKGCLGTATAKAKVTKSLRFAVKNAMAVQTPQLYVDGRRLCDEDTDLGLEYMLNAWLSPDFASRQKPAPAPAAPAANGDQP